MYTFSRKYDEGLILAPTLDFRYEAFKYQCQIRIEHLQIDFCVNFQVNLTTFNFETIFVQVLILMIFK